jgi:hypothetical protein
MTCSDCAAIATRAIDGNAVERLRTGTNQRFHARIQTLPSFRNFNFGCRGAQPKWQARPWVLCIPVFVIFFKVALAGEGVEIIFGILMVENILLSDILTNPFYVSFNEEQGIV